MVEKSILKFRRFLGTGCMFLIPLCIVLYQLFGIKIDGFNPAISFSSFYWTNSRNIFVMGLTFLIAFFVIYEGYDWRDKVIGYFSALFLVGVIVFPIESDRVVELGLPLMYNVFPNINSKVCCIIHNICGVGMFGLQSVNVAFLFTRSSGEKTKQKKIRNIIYYSCAASTILFVLIIVINIAVFKHVEGDLLGIILQMLGFIIIGFCWLVKGEFFKALNDKIN